MSAVAAHAYAWRAAGTRSFSSGRPAEYAMNALLGIAIIAAAIAAVLVLAEVVIWFRWRRSRALLLKQQADTSKREALR
jgi:hypothetical protein